MLSGREVKYNPAPVCFGLKALITLTVSWINTHLLTKRYVNEMPDA